MTTSNWNASDYAASASTQRGWARELIDKLGLDGHEHILDLGCGDGRITAELAARVPHGRVVGIDSSTAMIELARARYHAPANLAFEVMDARELAFDRAFDIVFSNAVLHWVSDHRAVVRGIARSLSPGGRALLQMGGRGNAADVIRAVDAVTSAPRWRSRFEGFAFPYSFYGPAEYRRWLPEAGLVADRVELIPKDMSHDDRAGLVAWLRTTWHPYTARVPAEDRDAFIDDIVARYLEAHPVDAHGRPHVRMVRLEVAASSPA